MLMHMILSRVLASTAGFSIAFKNRSPCLSHTMTDVASFRGLICGLLDADQQDIAESYRKNGLDV